MKKKFSLVLALALIMSSICVTPAMASTKVGKTKLYFGTTYTTTNKGAAKPRIQFDASNAKKYEIYRATSYNGKYKKIKTVSKKKGNMQTFSDSSKSGFYFYKIRGVNGSKKGSFSPKLPLYAVSAKLVSVKKSGNYSILKISINNSKSSTPITVGKSGSTWSYIDENCESYSHKAVLVDKNGKVLSKSQKIAKKKTGTVYFRVKNTKYPTYFSHAKNHKNCNCSITFNLSAKSGKTTYKYDLTAAMDGGSPYSSAVYYNNKVISPARG